MFEARILCQFLPKNFDDLDSFLGPTGIYSPLCEDHISVEFKRKRYKSLQETKRTWLQILVRAYELKNQEYAQQYQQELATLQLQLSTRTVDNERRSLIETVKAYMAHRKHRLVHDLEFNVSFYRAALGRRRQRCSSSSTKKTTVGVSPEVILFTNSIALNAAELAHLSKGNTCSAERERELHLVFLSCSTGNSNIRPNQIGIRPCDQRRKQAEKESNEANKKIHEFFSNHQQRYHIPPKSGIFKRYAELLQALVVRRYTAPLAHISELRGRRQLDLAKSIRRKLRQSNQVLCEVDKGASLCILPRADYERKAAEHRQTTDAYEELTSNPLRATMEKVRKLLNDLHMGKNRQLEAWQYKEMMPKQGKVELAYMYFKIKAHKVINLSS